MRQRQGGARRRWRGCRLRKTGPWKEFSSFNSYLYIQHECGCFRGALAIPANGKPAGWGARAAEAFGVSAETTMSKAILYDATLCIGCKQCEQACADKNKLPYNDTVA